MKIDNFNFYNPDMLLKLSLNSNIVFKISKGGSGVCLEVSVCFPQNAMEMFSYFPGSPLPTKHLCKHSLINFGLILLCNKSYPHLIIS